MGSKIYYAKRTANPMVLDVSPDWVCVFLEGFTPPQWEPGRVVGNLGAGHDGQDVEVWMDGLISVGKQNITLRPLSPGIKDVHESRKSISRVDSLVALIRPGLYVTGAPLFRPGPYDPNAA